MFNNLDNRWKFPVRCAAVTFKHCVYIHPLKQEDIQVLVNQAKEDSNIVRLIVFGSSVSIECRPWSDIDLYVETLSPDKPELDTYCLRTESVDILTQPLDFSFGVGYSIARDGIVIYER